MKYSLSARVGSWRRRRVRCAPRAGGARLRLGVALLVVGLGALAARPVAAAELSLRIEGLSDTLEEAVRVRLTLAQYAGREVQRGQLRRLVARAEDEIRRALEPYGYYAPEIERELERRDDTYHFTYSIDAGEPVRVRTLRVEVPGPAGAHAGVRAALDAFEPEPGDRLVHGTYERSKDTIRAALQAEGYLDAAPATSRVEVVLDTRSAAVELVWDPGERHRLGPVRFSPAQFPETFLDDFVPWERGDPYTAEALLRLQERLTATGYFSSVSVQPDLDSGEPVVPVDVVLVPDEQTAYSAGLFISTDVGPGGRLGVDRRWVNDRGHTLDGQIEYASNLQRGLLSYGIPIPGNGGRAIQFGAAYTDEETDTSLSENARVVAAETRQRWYGFTRSLGLQFLTGDFEVADEGGSSSLLFAEFSLGRTSADDPLQPRRGYSFTTDLRASPGGVLSDASFVQLRASGRLIRSLGDSSRLLLHAAAGALRVDDFDELPPELRFFAGGDRSIRGFDFEEIGATNRAGGVIGGEYLLTGGIEVEHYFLPEWGAAAFVDGGDAFRAGFELNVGAGLGLRWKSPIGVVRLDVARPIVSDLAEGWRIHLVIGPDL